MALYINGIVICETFKDADDIFSFFSNSPYMHKLENSEPRKVDGYWHLPLNPRGIGHGCSYDSELDREKYQNRSSEIVQNIYSELICQRTFELALIGEEILDRFYDKTEVNVTNMGGIKIPTELIAIPDLVISNKLYKRLKNNDNFEENPQGSYWHVGGNR